tara:strand:+ start:426 stop:866 length:441 start_codon:yes stop_codon:yes gene_type:complete
MKLNVGQIIYILSRKEMRVFPVIVVEEICRKTLDEMITSYVVRLPNKEKSEMLLDEIDAEVFTSVQSVEEKMKRSAYEKIMSILSSAKKMESVFQESIEKAATVEHIQDDSHVENREEESQLPQETVKVDLGNGITAKFDPSSIGV